MTRIVSLILLAWVLLVSPGAAQTLDAARAAWAAGDYARAAELTDALIATGAPDALALMGLMRRDGVGAAADLDAAIVLFETAAASGSVTADVALGRLAHHGAAGVLSDPQEAQRRYERVIEAGSPAARANLAALISTGVFGEPDWTALRGLLQSAAEDGSRAAALQLATLDAQGLGGPPDTVQARSRAQALAEEGLPAAMRLLAQMQLQGVGGPVNLPEGRAGLAAAAEAGDGSAATDLGLLYRAGGAGLDPDPQEAAVWFQRAADLGDGWGALHLARLLSDGDAAVADDPARAQRLFALAHETGNSEASYALAIRFWDGVGTDPDPETARRIMRIAALRGSAAAMNDLGVMLETGVGGPPDPVAARDAYRDSAEAGYALGAWNLADLLLSAQVPPADPVEGYAWCLWAIAAERDDALRARHEASCGAYADLLSEDVIRAAEVRLAQLPDPAR